MKGLFTISLLCLFLILLSEGDLHARNSFDTVKVLNTELKPKKRSWRVSGELLLVQLIPWSYNYFIRDADFAHISFASIGPNLQFKNWEFDDNKFTTNQFAHPYAFQESKKPFNNFDLLVELGDDDSTKLTVARVNGLLTSWEL